jgi:hypothetical protein
MTKSKIRKDILKRFSQTKGRKEIQTDELLKDAKKYALHGDGDFISENRLLDILKDFSREGLIKPPKGKKDWGSQTSLPKQITLKETPKELERKENKRKIEEIRNTTSWEFSKMNDIIFRSKAVVSLKAYKKALAVNHYLRDRNKEEPMVPSRERSLQIFGNEKTLDGSDVKVKGLFSGQITLKDLDCYYCPEPLPHESLSSDVKQTQGKPLLLVENSNTYRSCWQANAITKTFAAVVYGKGYKAAAKSMEEDGLLSIETQLESCGIWYFGDLDPDGLEIPKIINKNREKLGLSRLLAGIPFYKALMEKGFLVFYENSQKNKHDREWALQWLGKDLAQAYLDQVDCVRWPQEGLGQRDLIPILVDFLIEEGRVI